MEPFVVELNEEEESIRQVIEPLLESEGFELVRIRLKRSNQKSILAIFIDTKDQENGVILENLADVSRLLSDVLDAQFADNNALNGPYDLEVSSPGLDRPLTKLSHFKGALLKKIKLKLKFPNESGAKNIVGILHEVMNEGVIIAPEHIKEESVRVLFENIAGANLVFDFSDLDKNKIMRQKK